MKKDCCRFMVVLFSLSVGAWIRPASAEQQRGGIEVIAKDANDQLVAGATVTFRQQSSGQSLSRVTDSEGRCSVEDRPIGLYTVTISATGYKTYVNEKVEVFTAKTAKVEALLETGSIAEQVTVTASGSSSVETESVALSTTFTEKQIEKLPISGDHFSLLLLLPGANRDPISSSGIGISANGNRTRSNSFFLDGTDVSDSYRNTVGVNGAGSSAAPPTILPTAAVTELSVLTNFGTNDGRSSGAVVNMSIKSGSNDVKGTLFESLRTDALNAREFFNSAGPENRVRYNNFGVEIGGPLKKNKVFAFAAYEGKLERKDIMSFSSVPTNSDFSRAITTLGGDPATPLEQNPVVNPIIQNLIVLCRSSGQCPGNTALWPQPTPGFENRVLNALAPMRGRIRSHSLVFKPDWGIGLDDHLSGYYAFSDASQSLPLTLAGGGDLPKTNTLTFSRSNVISVSYFRSRPKESNEVRVGWNRYRRKFLDEDRIGVENPNQSIKLNTGVVDPRDFGLPHLVVQPFEALGASPFSNPRGWRGTNWHVTENLNWYLTPNNVKMGYEFSRSTISSFNDVNFRGKLVFASLEDFLAGIVRGGSISRGTSDRTTTQNIHGLYVQDTLIVGKRLTLIFGGRWEYFGVIHEDHGLFSTYDPSRGLIAPMPLYEHDLNNFSPRAGFAWDVTGSAKTIIRSGAGIYFDAFPQDFFVGQTQFNTFNPGLAYNPITTAPILSSRSPASPIQSGQPVFPASSFTSDTRDVWSIGKIRTPYALNFNVNLQRELTRSGVIQLAYVGSIARKLFRTRDINAPLVPGGPRPFDGTAQLSAPAPNQPYVVNQLETSAKSNYNSLQISFNLRGWRGFTNTAEWTWSHSIDDASNGIELVPNMAAPDNPRAPVRERANSNFDTRHRITSSFIYEIPRSNALGRLGKGWQLSGILTLSSGQPYHVNFSEEFDSRGAYDFVLRPDIVGDPYFGTKSPDRLLNLAAFAVPCTLDGLGTDVSHCLPGTLHFGNLPRNNFVGPNLKNFDFGISKITDITERTKLEFKADIYNLTNHPNFESPLLPHFIARASIKGIDANGRGGARGTGCNSAAASDDCYLQATRTRGPRTVQLSVRLHF